MTQDKQLKRRARALAAETGQSYQSALYQLDPTRGGDAGPRPPAVFSPDEPADGPRLSWAQLIERLDDAEAHLDDPDPYARAAAFASRARLHEQLYAQTTDPVYAAACARAAVCDDITAARIRYEHGIPTIMPRTEAELLGLRRCEFCGRPWQISDLGACPRCPRLRFGPTPNRRPDGPGRGEPAALHERDREELHDELTDSIEKHQQRGRWVTGGQCEHGAGDGGANCAACLAQLVLNVISELGEDDFESAQGLRELTEGVLATLRERGPASEESAHVATPGNG